MASCSSSTGCQWRYIPRDLPPRSTLFDYFQRWEYDGTLLRIHYELYQKCRELVDRQASPTACVIDSQSVKSAEKGGAHIDPSGYDAGKKINGKKRHILVDTEGLLLHAVVHPADVQERDGGILLLATLFGLYPFLKKLFADGGYQGAEIPHRTGQGIAWVGRRNRQTFGYRPRLRGSAQTLGRRTNFRLAQPVSSIGEGFREPDP